MPNERLLRLKDRVPRFNNIDHLTQSCHLKRTVVDGGYRFCFGLKARHKFTALTTSDLEMVYGVYGLEKLDKKTGEVVARSGFDIENDVMKITHTPQGNLPFVFSTSTVRNRLGRSDFRGEMMTMMIEIAKNLRLREVTGEPAAIQDKVIIGLVDYDKVYRAVDEVFQLNGFSFSYDDLRYHLPISSF